MTTGAGAGSPGQMHDRRALPQVTLFAASSLAIEATLRALNLSAAQMAFGAVRFFTDVPVVDGRAADIEVVPISRLNSRADYSRFMLRDLADLIDTEFALCVQWDGYIVDAKAWTDEFLTVDYVGAPWPHFPDRHDVGNGGFSLRSHKLLQACRELPFDVNDAEDIVIGRRCRDVLEQAFGIGFADRDLARRFSYERAPRFGDEFGFHGVFNMMDHMGPAEFRTLYASLEPELLGRRETSDLLRRALRSGDWRLLLAIGRNRIARMKGNSQQG